MNGLTPDQDPAQNGVPLDAPPSIRQGFGRLQLNSSLPLSGLNSGLSLQASTILPLVQLSKALWCSKNLLSL